MKKNEKRMILILLMILAIVIIAVVIGKNKGNTENTEDNQVKEEFVEVLEDGTKLNISTKLVETKTVGAYKIGNIQLTMKDNQSVLLADVENTSTTSTEMRLLDITLYDKEGNVLEVVPGIVIPLEPGATTQLNAGVTSDYANAYDFKVEIK